MSPRRSSRSKIALPTSLIQHTNSSSSSVSSARADHRSRSENKLPSPQSSAAPRSPSPSTREASNKPQARRTRSSQEVPIPKTEVVDTQVVDDVGEDDGYEDDEEEITRCVCGQPEYPGMPIPPSKAHAESGNAGSPTTIQEDTGGLFIQCDVCKVWQHGGCVGIMDEPTSPENYFCEQCRKDLHTIVTTATGQTHSIYLPVQKASPPESPPSSVPQESSIKKSKERRSSRSNAEGSAGKRRSTMNSRDAAYYEAEQLRRAIEESKREGAIAAGSGSRKGKRTRDANDQPDEGSKRQRTESASSASSNDKQRAQADEGENKDSNAGAPTAGKNIRGAAARNHRNKELRQREEKQQKDRLDAASKRKGRAERRRGDESDPSEEPLSRTISSKGVDKGAVETLPASQAQPLPKSSHHKKTGRPPARRGRVGRNQYTRDRDRPGTPKNGHDAASPTNSHSSKEGHNSPRGNGETGKQSKVRHMNPNRTTMNDMKRRVAGILEFIGRTQVEMATEMPLLPGSKTPSPPSREAKTAKRPVTPPEDEQQPGKGGKDLQPELQQQQKFISAVNAELDLEQFKHLGSLEMMEVLTRKLMKWQGEYGKYGEK